MSGLLEGIRVIDMGHVVAIPSAGAIMADWGAEVIKLEALTGEFFREVIPNHGVATGDINWNIEVLNRGKKALALDLKKKEGREILYRLVKTADVFMSNYERSEMKKLGADYATLSKHNPKLVYAFLSGYGPKGPEKNERGFDYSSAWARSGAMYLVGEPGSPPPPQRHGMMDSVVAAHTVSGITAALFHRERTGEGQEFDISLYHTGVWTVAIDIQSALAGQPLPRHERARPYNPIWNSYRTKDGRWFWLAMLQGQSYWPIFCRSIERPEFVTDSRFTTPEARTANATELIRLIDEIMATRTMTEWEVRFREHGCIVGRVATPEEVISDPQALANDLFAEMEFPGIGKQRLVNTPVRFRQNPAEIKHSAPKIGEHTSELLTELGYGPEEISGFRAKKVIP